MSTYLKKFTCEIFYWQKYPDPRYLLLLGWTIYNEYNVWSLCACTINNGCKATMCNVWVHACTVCTGRPLWVDTFQPPCLLSWLWETKGIPPALVGNHPFLLLCVCKQLCCGYQRFWLLIHNQLLTIMVGRLFSSMVDARLSSECYCKFEYKDTSSSLFNLCNKLIMLGENEF